MSDFVLRALEFGVLGLCAITLLLVSRIIKVEQAREGCPRKGILQACYVFMAFCFVLAVLNGYVQLRERSVPPGTSSQLVAVQDQLREAEDKLLRIRSAASPILFARANILDRLPDGPERETLLDLVNSLREVLDE